MADLRRWTGPVSSGPFRWRARPDPDIVAVLAALPPPRRKLVERELERDPRIERVPDWPEDAVRAFVEGGRQVFPLVVRAMEATEEGELPEEVLEALLALPGDVEEQRQALEAWGHLPAVRAVLDCLDDPAPPPGPHPVPPSQVLDPHDPEERRRTLWGRGAGNPAARRMYVETWGEAPPPGQEIRR